MENMLRGTTRKALFISFPVGVETGLVLKRRACGKSKACSLHLLEGRFPQHIPRSFLKDNGWAKGLEPEIVGEWGGLTDMTEGRLKTNQATKYGSAPDAVGVQPELGGIRGSATG